MHCLQVGGVMVKKKKRLTKHSISVIMLEYRAVYHDKEYITYRSLKSLQNGRT